MSGVFRKAAPIGIAELERNVVSARHLWTTDGRLEVCRLAAQYSTSELASELVKKTPGPVARRQRRVSYGGDGGWGFWPNSMAT